MAIELDESQKFIALKQRVAAVEARPLGNVTENITNNEYITNNTTTVTGGNMAARSGYASLSAALTAIGSVPTTLLHDTDSTVSTAVVIPANVRIVPTNGAKFQKFGSGTLTINSTFDAPPEQVFSGFGSGEVVLNGAVREFYPQWFGAKGDGIQGKGAVILSGSLGTLSSNEVAFTSADVGKSISIPVGSGLHTTSIASYVSPSQITLTTPAASAVSGKRFWYGTDDTGAINATIKAVAASPTDRRGGDVVFVRTSGFYLIDGEINGERTTNVRYRGVFSGSSLGDYLQGGLVFTAGSTSDRLFSLRSSYATIFSRLSLVYVNPSFTGRVLDGGRHPSYGDPQGMQILDSSFSGGYLDENTAVFSAAALVSLKEAIIVNVERNLFSWAQVGIWGRDGGAYSNVVNVKDNQFIRLVHGIRDGVEVWNITGNTFEPGISPSGVGGTDFFGYSESTGGYNINITGNWFGDSGLAGTSRWIQVKSFQTTIEKNFFGVGYYVAKAPILVDLTTNVDFVTLRDNIFSYFSYGVDIDGPAILSKFSYENERMVPGSGFTYRRLLNGASITQEYVTGFQNGSDLTRNKMPELTAGNTDLVNGAQLSQLVNKSTNTIGYVSGLSTLSGGLAIASNTLSGTGVVAPIEFFTGIGNGVVSFDRTDVNATNNTIDMGTDALATGTEIMLTENGLPSPLIKNTKYWAINAGGNLIKVAASLSDANNGTAIDLTKASFTTADVNAYYTFTVDPATDIFTTTANHNFTTGNAVNFTSTGTAATYGVSFLTGIHYVRVLSATTFKIATTAQNATDNITLDILTAGTGTHKAARHNAESIRLPSHQLAFGDAVVFSGGTTLPTGFTAGVTYYPYPSSNDDVFFATSLSNAESFIFVTALGTNTSGTWTVEKIGTNYINRIPVRRFSVGSTIVADPLAGVGDRLLYVNASGQLIPVTLGTGLTFTGGVLSAT